MPDGISCVASWNFLPERVQGEMPCIRPGEPGLMTAIS